MSALQILFAAALSFSEAAFRCPAGLEPWYNGYCGRRLMFHVDIHWQFAFDACKKIGMAMLSIHDYETSLKLRDSMTTTLWIGWTCNGNTPAWSDGSPIDYINGFTNISCPGNTRYLISTFVHSLDKWIAVSPSLEQRSRFAACVIRADEYTASAVVSTSKATYRPGDEIYSPGFPDGYSKGVVEYAIEADDSNSKLIIEIRELSLEVCCSTLTIYHGDGNAKILKQLTGQKASGLQYITEGSFAKLVFNASRSSTFAGWSVKIGSVKDAVARTPRYECPGLSQPAWDGWCGEKIIYDRYMDYKNSEAECVSRGMHTPKLQSLLDYTSLLDWCCAMAWLGTECKGSTQQWSDGSPHWGNPHLPYQTWLYCPSNNHAGIPTVEYGLYYVGNHKLTHIVACTTSIKKVAEPKSIDNQPTACPAKIFHPGDHIYSPGYPGGYEVGSCEYIILAAKHTQKIVLEFVDFSVCTCCAALEVYEGVGESNQITKSTGIEPAGTRIVPSKPCMRLVWNATKPGSRAGWHIIIHAVEETP